MAEDDQNQHDSIWLVHFVFSIQPFSMGIEFSQTERNISKMTTSVLKVNQTTILFPSQTGPFSTTITKNSSNKTELYYSSPMYLDSRKEVNQKL